MERGLFTIVHLGTGGRDKLGKPIVTVLSRTPSDGRLEQTGSAEGETFVVNEFRAFFPAGTKIAAGDEVEVRGARYKVNGKIGRAHV